MPCKCPACFSLAEHMQEVTGKDYGLQPAPGHSPGHFFPLPQPVTLSADELRERRARIRNRKALPWEVDAA